MKYQLRWVAPLLLSLGINTAYAVVYQAESYNDFKDTTSGNAGGAYRSDDVDIETTSDAGGGYNVGWIETGEWLVYNNFKISTTGSYTINMRVASPNGATAAVDLNGGTIPLGDFAIPATDGWQKWITVSKTVNINAGTYNLGVFAATSGWNFNWIQIVPNSSSSSKSSDSSKSSSSSVAAAGGRVTANPIGIENVNDSPLKASNYQALLRFVPRTSISIDRFYFGFKLQGANCWDAGNAGYGAGDGGLVKGTLVEINQATGLPSTQIASETVNGCTRHNAAMAEVGGGTTSVLVWVNTPANLEAGKMYGLIVSNVHSNPANNFFSFNMPLADTSLAGPHARNELNANATGALLSLDPREHVAWSENNGSSWQYGSLNGQYRSYMNDHDTAHPATRMPQYGFRLTNGTKLAGQPYYAYSDDCSNCTTAYANAKFMRAFSELGAFTASGNNVGTLTITNTSSGEQSSCTPSIGYGFRKCSLSTPITVFQGQTYTVRASGSVEIMKMDYSQRFLFPGVGTSNGELRTYQPNPASETNKEDVPSIWAGPYSTLFPLPTEN